MPGMHFSILDGSSGNVRRLIPTLDHAEPQIFIILHSRIVGYRNVDIVRIGCLPTQEVSRLEVPNGTVFAEALPRRTVATVPLTASILKGRRKSRRN